MLARRTSKKLVILACRVLRERHASNSSKSLFVRSLLSDISRNVAAFIRREIASVIQSGLASREGSVTHGRQIEDVSPTGTIAGAVLADSLRFPAPKCSMAYSYLALTRTLKSSVWKDGSPSHSAINEGDPASKVSTYITVRPPTHLLPSNRLAITLYKLPDC